MALTQVTTDGIANAAITQEKISSSVSLGGGGGTTAYSTLAALPLSNNTSGSMAFVAENNKLYIWNGTGWFNIALINTSPTITSGPDVSYEFDISGTPTIITLAAEDPEGLPVTWSYQVTNGTLGNTATIAQNSNVFTITPSTSSADAGTFSITFTASDGVNLATATSSFELTFGPSTIGQAFGGGFYAGEISTTGDGVATHYLIVGPVSTAQSTLKWKTANTATTGTDSVIDGPANTAAMIAAGAAAHPAAQFCDNLVVGSYSDWYMPARNELEVCYYNLKPSTVINNLGSGVNANAVPARASEYTAGIPAQTSATNFITSTGSQAFTTDFYWSSTQGTTTFGRVQVFSNGYQRNAGKQYAYNVRAVRRVAVPPPPPPPPPTTIGETYAGGFYAGEISTTGDGVATHYLVVGPLSTAQATHVYKTTNTETANTSSNIDGPANTAAMIAAGAAAHPAAQFCDNLVVGGYSDWYMPARNELEVCYYNLKPTTTNNSTSTGINSNAVPARASNYTISTPAQTSAAIFRTGGAEAFVTGNYYWSSTQLTGYPSPAAAFIFSNGAPTNANKNTSYIVRAVRRVAV